MSGRGPQISDDTGDSKPGRIRVGLFVTHPIQYFAPIWRRLAATPDIDLRVYFFSDHSVRGGVDPGFGREVKWDVPLLDGYAHEFLSRDVPLDRPAATRMADPGCVFDAGQFDAVMIHGYTHGFERQVVAQAKRRGIPIVMRGEFTDVTPFGGRGRLKAVLRDLFLRRFYRTVAAFCYIGQDARAHLLRLGVREHKLHFSPYSVDTTLFDAQMAQFDRKSIRAELKIPDDGIVLLFSGKFIPRKDPLALIEAVAGMEPNAASRVWIIMIGDGELHAQVASRGKQVLGDRLILPGFVNQSQIGQYFVAADVFVLPSLFETWGLVVNEAMQFGLPVIATDRVGATRDLVETGLSGVVYSAGDRHALGAAIDSLVRSPSLVSEMGDAAKRKVSDYNTSASVTGILKALRAITTFDRDTRC
jgi:glycosyltransferase involved in cell wall biosynthesis